MRKNIILGLMLGVVAVSPAEAKKGERIRDAWGNVEDFAKDKFTDAKHDLKNWAIKISSRAVIRVGKGLMPAIELANEDDRHRIVNRGKNVGKKIAALAIGLGATVAAVFRHTERNAVVVFTAEQIAELQAAIRAQVFDGTIDVTGASTKGSETTIDADVTHVNHNHDDAPINFKVKFTASPEQGIRCTLMPDVEGIRPVTHVLHANSQVYEIYNAEGTLIPMADIARDSNLLTGALVGNDVCNMVSNVLGAATNTPGF